MKFLAGSCIVGLLFLEFLCENRGMSKESSNERDVPEGAAGASGHHGRPSGEHGRPSVDPAGELPPRADRSIKVDAEQLTIGELDLLAAREVLGELGARGSAPLDSLDIDGTMTLLETIVGLEGALESLRARNTELKQRIDTFGAARDGTEIWQAMGHSDPWRLPELESGPFQAEVEGTRRKRA